MFWVSHRSTTDANHFTAGRSPHADRLAVRSAYMWHRHKGRRAWLRASGEPSRPSDYLSRRAGVCLIAAVLIVACDHWPAWLA